MRRHCLKLSVVPLLILLILPHETQAGPTHSDVTTVGGIAGGLASVAGTIFTWGFGAFLEASILLHTGAIWAADKVEVGFIPDPNFNSLAAITVPPAPSIATDNLIDPSDIGAANTLLQNLTQSIGALRSLDTTLNRQYTAASQGEFSAALLQHNYVTTTIIPALQSATSSADANLAEIISGFTDVSLTSTQVQTYVVDVNANGFPQDEINIFNLLQATPMELSAALMTLNFPDFSTQSVYSLQADGLENARLLMQLTVPFAEAVAAAAPVPEPSTILLLASGLAVIIGLGRKTQIVAWLHRRA